MQGGGMLMDTHEPNNLDILTVDELGYKFTFQGLLLPSL